ESHLPGFVASDFIPKSQPELTMPRSCEPEKEQRNSVSNRSRGMYPVDGRGSIALRKCQAKNTIRWCSFGALTLPIGEIAVEKSGQCSRVVTIKAQQSRSGRFLNRKRCE